MSLDLDSFLHHAMYPSRPKSVFEHPIWTPPSAYACEPTDRQLQVPNDINRSTLSKFRIGNFNRQKIISTVYYGSFACMCERPRATFE